MEHCMKLTMKYILGTKEQMTQIFNEDGMVIPATIISVPKAVITQLKSEETDGYTAIQVGYEDKKEKNTPAALQGHFKKAKTTPKRKLVEFETFSNDVKLGDTISAADVFADGEFVDVIGTSKGKGFQGVVKRHGFSGVGMATHGQHNRLRAPGSIGAGSDPSRVFPGMKMAGRMGGDTVKLKGIKILKIVEEKNILVVKGSVPGSIGSYVVLQNKK